MRRPEPTEWSVFECAAHIVDAEIVYSGRDRWILAHERPDLPGYDQDRWRGPESLDLSFKIVAGHDRFHLAQAKRALEQVCATGG